jgi:hypothetical protein
MVYIGNWILNSTRGNDRITEYDEIENRVFSHCEEAGMASIADKADGVSVPSAAFENGGIHEAIADYEDTVFFEILAEELARRDMDFEPISTENWNELTRRIDAYIEEFEENGMDNIVLEK